MSDTLEPKSKKKNEVAIFDVKKFSIAQLPELKNKKEEIASIIAENPIVEIIDTETYDQAKKSRTAVKTLRTGTQREHGEVKREVKTLILDAIDNEYDLIIEEIKLEEQKRQDIVTAYELKKEAEKAEKARVEQQRINTIKNTIDDYVAEWKVTFNIMSFETIEQVGANFLESYTSFDLSVLEEFEALFPARIEELTQYLSDKSASLINAENARLEKIRIEEESAKLAKEKKEFEDKKKLADEAEAKAKKEREDFEKEKADFAKKQAEANAKLAEAVQSKQPKRLESLEVLATDLPTVNVCNGLDVKTMGSVVDRMIPLVESYNAAELKRMQSITWETIQKEFKDSGQKSYSKFLVDNYNAPTKL